MRFVSIALINDGEALVNPETVELIRAPTPDELPAGAVIQFTSGLTLRVRDSRISTMQRLWATGE